MAQLRLNTKWFEDGFKSRNIFRVLVSAQAEQHLVAELFGMNPGQFGERVFLRDYEHWRESLQFHPLKPFKTRLQTPGKNRDVDLLGGGSLPHRLGREIGEFKKNILVVRLEALNDPRHDPSSEGVNIPNA